MNVKYYPGCSLHSTAKEYDESTKAVFSAFELDIPEVSDWNCCGATSAHSTNGQLGIALAARNLAQADAEGADLVVAPCAACYSRLKKAAHHIRRRDSIRQMSEHALDYRFSRVPEVENLLEFMHRRITAAAIERKVKQPLKLKLACYYGCLLLRPAEVTGVADPENPRMMEDIMEALGASCVRWSYRTECCGANLSLTSSRLVVAMVKPIVAAAIDAGADAIVTACPLCQANLEMRRSSSQRIPVFYFTELMGVALGLHGTRRWLARHLVSTKMVFEKLKAGVEA
ncbi:MAG: CoB--CoM heterodisulfide reductase iron-sulfur subunit B family protein [Bacillota bacterium]